MSNDALRPLLKNIMNWAALSFALKLVCEVLQLPLYTIGRTGSLPQLVFALLHCTAGDALIAVAC